MTAQSILAQARAAGLVLRPNGDNIGIRPAARLSPELREAIAACKTEVLRLLREKRQAEISTAYAEAFSRLSNTYGGDLVGTQWERITSEHPALARAIATSEAACDAAALDYQRGTAPDSGPFLTCLQTWKTARAEAIAVVTSNTCGDCGKRAVVLVTTDYGARYCPRRLRPDPLNRKGAPRA